MRRPLCSIVALSLLVASCARSSVEPRVILERAARANQLLSSASFEASVALQNPSGTWEWTAEGTMQDGGRLMESTFVLQSTPSGSGRSISVQGKMVVPGTPEMLLMIASVEGPSRIRAATEAYLNRWYRLPNGGSVGITPDAGLLRAQSDVVTVTEDLGVTTINGRTAHHYRTAVEEELLVDFLEEVAKERQEAFDPALTQQFMEEYRITGELYIEAETYYLLRARWLLEPKIENGMAGQVTISFSDQGNAPAPTIPKDVSVLQPMDILTIITSLSGTGSPLPALLPPQS